MDIANDKLSVQASHLAGLPTIDDDTGILSSQEPGDPPCLRCLAFLWSLHSQLSHKQSNSVPLHASWASHVFFEKQTVPTRHLLTVHDMVAGNYILHTSL